MRFRRARFLIPAALVVLIAATLGVLRLTGVIGPDSPQSAEPFARGEPSHCVVYEESAGVRLTLDGWSRQGKAQSECNRLAGSLSGSGSYWVVGLPSIPEEEPQLICDLQEPGSINTMVVEQTPETFLSTGRTICGNLTHNGWRQNRWSEEEGPWQWEYREARTEEARQSQQEFRQATREWEEEGTKEHVLEECLTRIEEKAEAEDRSIEENSSLSSSEQGEREAAVSERQAQRGKICEQNPYGE